MALPSFDNYCNKLIYLIDFFLRSPEWRFIPDDEKKKLGLTNDDDGEFWYVFFLVSFSETFQ